MTTNLKFRVWDEKYNCWDNSPLMIYPNTPIAIQGRVIQPSVGFHDKNGKLMFDGDILEDDHGYKYEIFWLDVNACFSLAELDNDIPDEYEVLTFSYRNIHRLKIIGNKFENKELYSNTRKS
jgi:hypothetical protein